MATIKWQSKRLPSSNTNPPWSAKIFCLHGLKPGWGRNKKSTTSTKTCGQLLHGTVLGLPQDCPEILSKFCLCVSGFSLQHAPTKTKTSTPTHSQDNSPLMVYVDCFGRMQRVELCLALPVKIRGGGFFRNPLRLSNCEGNFCAGIFAEVRDGGF